MKSMSAAVTGLQRCGPYSKFPCMTCECRDRSHYIEGHPMPDDWSNSAMRLNVKVLRRNVLNPD